MANAVEQEPTLLTDEEVGRLQDLLHAEDLAATQQKWATGDFLVLKIDQGTHVSTLNPQGYNGRDKVIADAATRSGSEIRILHDRYVTSRIFSEDKRRTELSWSLHRRFAHHGEDKASVWMEEFLATGVKPTIRAAEEWMARVKNTKTNAGRESAEAIARSITVVADAEKKGSDVVSALPESVQKAIVEKVIANSPKIAKAASKAVVGVAKNNKEVAKEVAKNVVQEIGSAVAAAEFAAAAGTEAHEVEPEFSHDPRESWQVWMDRSEMDFTTSLSEIDRKRNAGEDVATAVFYSRTKLEGMLARLVANFTVVPNTPEELFR